MQPGDVVVIKAGGPKMTVERVGGVEGQVFCLWFDGSELHHGTFTEQTLRLAKSDE